jgi:hypothetical protein
MRLLLTLVLMIVATQFPSNGAYADSRTLLDSKNADQINEFCVFNGKLFSVGAILCAGERRGFQCKAHDDKNRASWFTQTNNSDPMNDGCKGPMPLN